MTRLGFAFAFAVSSLFAGGAAPVHSAAMIEISNGISIMEHGGGCRRSSPPGQCCHMDNSVGRVHCH